MTGGPMPTRRELAIMRIVWEKGEATVREVHEALTAGRPVAYTTVMTLMNILAAKGALTRTRRDRAYIYRPVRPRQRVVKGLVRDFLDRVFDGAAAPLLIHLVTHEKLDPEARRELRRLIDEMEE